MLAAYCGVAPFWHRETSVNTKSLHKCYSNRKLGALLSWVAISAVRFSLDIKVYYDWIVAAGKPKELVPNIVWNKLIHIMFSIVRNGCDYEEGHKWERKQWAGNNAIQKNNPPLRIMPVYRKLLEQMRENRTERENLSRNACMVIKWDAAQMVVVCFYRTRTPTV